MSRVEPDFICKFCQSHDLILPSVEDWKMALFLYHTLIKPLETYVEKCENNRQRANVTLHTCTDFPSRTFDPSLYEGVIIEAHELCDEGSHVGIILYKIGLKNEFNSSNEGLSMSMTCKRKNIRTFTYQDITYFYGTKVKEVMPDGWDQLPGTQHLQLDSYDDFDNWLFYQRNQPLKRDSAKYQIIGWNDDEYCTFITEELESEERKIKM